MKILSMMTGSTMKVLLINLWGWLMGNEVDLRSNLGFCREDLASPAHGLEDEVDWDPTQRKHRWGICTTISTLDEESCNPSDIQCIF